MDTRTVLTQQKLAKNRKTLSLLKYSIRKKLDHLKKIVNITLFLCGKIQYSHQLQT
jgi:hypothetical protein